MKYALLLILITSVVLAQTPAQYRVVRVVGKVESPALSRELKTGDVIQSKDQLKFATKESYIIVNSPQTGRKRISGVPDNSPREFLQLLQSFVQPELKSTASRNIALEYLEKLQNSLRSDTLLIIGDGFVPVNIEKLPLTKPAAIRAWHYDERKKPKYLKVSNVETKGFYLNKKSVYGDEQPKVLHKVVIEYFEDENEDPMFSPGVLLGSFVPMYADEATLSSEIKALVEALNKQDSKALWIEITAYLRDEYAPAQEDNLKAWLKTQGISIE